MSDQYAGDTLSEDDAPEPPKPRRPGAFAPGHDARRGHGSAGLGGRPKSAIRAACRESYEKRIHILEAIADGEPLPHFRRYKRANLPWTLKSSDPNPLGDPQEVIEIRSEESARIDERMHAVEVLGKMGGVNVPGEESGEEQMKDFVYQLSFD